MNRLLLLALGFLIPLLAHAQNLTVTVDGNPVENWAAMEGTNYDSTTGKVSATMQISASDYSSVPVTISTSSSNPIIVGDQELAMGEEFTYDADFSNGQPATITFSTINYEKHCSCNIKIGNELTFSLYLHFDPISTIIDGMTFTRNPLGDATCTMASYSGEYEEVTIPETVEIEGSQYIVNEIGYRAFFNNKIIKSISLPESIKYIRDSAFAQCEILETINLPEGLIEIEQSAFRYCKLLSNPNFPSSIKNLGNAAYQYCHSINSLTIPNSIIYIGEKNFEYSPISILILEDGEDNLELGDDILGTYCNQLYIGRDLTGAKLSPGAMLSSFNIGAPVTNLDWFDPSLTPELLQIVSNSTTPPSIGRFSQEQYDNIYVFVPESAMDAYANDQNWAFFNHISGLTKPADEYEISIIPEQATINVGETLTVQCQVEPFIEAYLNMQISNNEVLNMYNFGEVYGAKAGEADVTATLLLNGKTATCHVTVLQPATSIRLNKTSLDLSKGESVKLLANIDPVDVSDSNVAWTSSNEAVATVGADGTVIAVGGGECDITATTHNGLTATCHVKVTVMPEGVSFDIDQSQILVGESLTITPVFTPADATETTLTWSTSDANIATVSNGLVTGVNPGTVTITATTVNNLMATCTVTVKQPVTSITLNPETATILKGETLTITATVLPENAEDKTLTWTSSNPTVATVNDGVVEALAQGEAIITATSANGITASSTITVIDKATEIVLDYYDIEVIAGNTFQLTATLLPEGCEPETLTWSSSHTSIATVDDNGLVTAVSPGTASITVMSSNGLTANCTVYVLPVLVETVTVTPYNVEAVEGTSVQLKAEVSPANATDTTVIWKSSNENVATVDEIGLVTIQSPGDAIVTATANDGGGAYGECNVTGVSGIDALYADGSLWDLYDVNGLLLKAAISANELKQMTPGVYILRSATRSIKLKL